MKRAELLPGNSTGNSQQNNGIRAVGLAGVLVLLSITLLSCTKISGETPPQQSKYLQAVQTFADNVLVNGKDTYGEIHSPLLVDGINVKTKEPVRWEFENHTWIISNFAAQQNLMRVFVGLTALTGDSTYRNKAENIVQYMYKHQSAENGLLYWGGHKFVDLQTMEPHFEGRPHELKNNYPFYEFMWEVDSSATRQMLHAMWNAHILDWSKLDLNRHGEYNLEMGKLWNHEFHQPEPFFEGEGLTFINAGTDMIQSAMTLYLLGNDEQAKTWGLRLYEQYVRARHPETNLGVYQYSRPKQTEKPPAEGPLTGELTFSRYGDRASNQFGEKYGSIALEGNVLWGSRMETLYGRSPVMILHLAEQLKNMEAGEKLKTWAIEGLKAYATYAYIPEENIFRPMWADGTDLTGDVYPRTGYYGKKGTPFKAVEPSSEMMLAAAKAVRLSEGETELWEWLRNMFKGEGLGDPGAKLDSESNLNYDTNSDDPTVLVTVLELYRYTEDEDFLRLAEKIGDNILANKFSEGYFRPTKNHIYTRFDRPEPLALLMLEAAQQGKAELVPPFVTGYGSTDGEPSMGGRPSDEYFYRETYD